MSSNNKKDFQFIFDTIIRLGVLFGLLAVCLAILGPFLSPVLWGLLIAVIFYPTYSFLLKKLNDRSNLAAFLIAAGMLAALILPTLLFVDSLVEGVQTLGSQMQEGEFQIPPPQESIKDWPLIGNQFYDFWLKTSKDLGKTLEQFDTQIASAGKFLLNILVETGLGFIQFLLAIIIAAVLLATSKEGKKFFAKLLDKIVGDRGKEFGNITELTIQNVAKGILGVSFIQSTLAGIGFLLAGVPYAGLWTLICLLLSVIQIGPGLVIIPVIIYLFTIYSPLAATLWAVYFIVVMISDNIMKPFMLGKGAPVPMLIIFIGSIGGFILDGFVGLFIGAIFLSIGYKLFVAWVNESPSEITPEDS